MPLSDTKLTEAILNHWITVIPEVERSRLQPAGIDLRLGPLLLLPKIKEIDFDLEDNNLNQGSYERYSLEQESDRRGYWLEPGEFVLGATLEYVAIGPRHCAHFTGRSTLGRCGLMVHVTAGFVDPGFSGNVTLEIKNVANYPMRLVTGMGIGQLLVEEMTGIVERSYGSQKSNSKYGSDQQGPVPPNLGRKM